MNAAIYDTILQALRAFYVVGLPVVVVLTVAGALAALLQTALGVQEQTVSYAVRLVAFVVLLYAFLPVAAQTVMSVAELALR